LKLQEFGSLIKPEEAEKVFAHTTGLTEQNAPFEAKKGTVDGLRYLLAHHTILGQKENIDVFQLRKVS
jgi:hypothetical protein